MRCAHIVAWLIASLVGLGGCASSPESSSDPLSAAPEDFSLELVVRTGRGFPERSEAHLRPGRWVMLADGSLHYGPESDHEADWLPARIRTLSRRQVAELWSLARQLGFANADLAGPATNLELIEPPADGLAYLIAFAGEGQRWSFVRSASADEPPDAAATILTRRLAQLAWVTDLPEERTVLSPHRYHFGPDPYARYREP
jgi:hypothetical protein